MKVKITSLVVAAGVAVGAPALAAPAPAPSAQGKQVFDYWCATCHAAGAKEGGRLLPGTQSLTVKYKGAKPAVLEERDDLVPEFTKFVVRHGQEGMPFFRKTEISDRELDAIAAYLARNVK
jgi:mono/diheme cytochrome c family protein